MKLLVSNCADGFGEKIEHVLATQCPHVEVKIVNSLSELEGSVRALNPGDVLIGQICDMKAGRILFHDEATSFINTLAEDWLPTGANATLFDTLRFASYPDVQEAIVATEGRVILVESPFWAKDLPKIVGHWQARSEFNGPQPGS